MSEDIKTECSIDGRVHVYSKYCKCIADAMYEDLKHLRDKIGKALLITGDINDVHKILLGDKK